MIATPEHLLRPASSHYILTSTRQGPVHFPLWDDKRTNRLQSQHHALSSNLSFRKAVGVEAEVEAKCISTHYAACNMNLERESYRNCVLNLIFLKW